MGSCDACGHGKHYLPCDAYDVVRELMGMKFSRCGCVHTAWSEIE